MSDLAAIRQLAYDHLLVLPGADESAGERDACAALEALSPSDRETALHIASRRLAFQMLYELDLRGEPILGWVQETLGKVEGLGPLAAAKVASLVEGAFAARTEADAEFEALAPDWPPHRQAAVDRTILRLAHYELSRTPTPPRVVVNEAVELAKHFSTEKSPAFINGLLDRVLRRLAERTPEAR